MDVSRIWRSTSYTHDFIQEKVVHEESDWDVAEGWMGYSAEFDILGGVCDYIPE